MTRAQFKALPREEKRQLRAENAGHIRKLKQEIKDEKTELKARVLDVKRTEKEIAYLNKQLVKLMKVKESYIARRS